EMKLRLVLQCALISIASSNVGRFWQITDLHLDFHYDRLETDTKKVCPSTYGFEALEPGVWGDYKCDSTWKLINSSIHAMRDIEANPDFILWTGDDTLHTTDEDRFLGEAKVVETIKNITDLIQQVFPQTKVFSALGNHDYQPKNNMPPGPSEILTEIAQIWRPWMTEDAFQLFNITGYYADDTTGNSLLKVIVLNTNLWDNYNDHISGEGDPSGQFSWLRSQLEGARRSGKKVYIIGHISPGFFELYENEFYLHENYISNYIAIVQEYYDVISGQFFAHNHMDSYRMFYNKDKQPISVLFLAPGVTPRVGTREGSVNPGIRLFQYNRTNMQIKNYDQYYFNLAAANKHPIEAEWTLEYSSSTGFEISDLSPTSMHLLLERMKKADLGCDPTTHGCENNRLFQRYVRFHSVSYDYSSCNDTCHRNHICAIQDVDVALHGRCI
uniref:Sphingomyelinase phosphodiesterase n=1 Tax=Ciona savignyi TaxID=51511 RepID=H2YX51_CIOSA